MYLTIEETAEYTNLSEDYIKSLVLEGKIRAVHDGEQFLIYKEQFETHLEQLENYKALVQEILNEQIPEDIDVKDED
ncbi:MULTISPECIES: excisionase family DNA-binding protein [Bacillus]|uniref:excisionase family DNA-binding protein n=1 Tax=Bacillus TaxID=1386 RepID=UPI0005303D70|nr:excisionase family DNA-binding protein [Bacillus subtilis]AIX07627.1 Helix-turn-helix domain protein [Bacillus subtilis]NTU15682.1 excisionase family DNA-binding protein [Bacillus subtilis subsp. subtilis]